MNIATAIKIAGAISTIAVDAQQAADLVGKAATFVQLVEQTGGSGADKLKAATGALSAYATSKYPDVIHDVGVAAGEFTALINGIVAIYNALGAFKKVTAGAGA